MPNIKNNFMATSPLALICLGYFPNNKYNEFKMKNNLKINSMEYYPDCSHQTLQEIKLYEPYLNNNTKQEVQRLIDILARWNEYKCQEELKLDGMNPLYRARPPEIHKEEAVVQLEDITKCQKLLLDDTYNDPLYFGP